jgi:hypothetical protein
MEDLIMKKLIMFLMVLAISVPALAIIDDSAPPMWGEAGGNTGVWHFDDPVWTVPSCLFGTDYYYFEIPGGTWSYGVITTGTEDEETLWGLIGIPEGGSDVTVHVQIAASKEIEDAAQTSLETRRRETAPGEEPLFITEIFPELVNAGGGVYTLTGTLPRASNAFYAGFYIEKNGLQIEGIIVDVITHDGETPPTGPARTISCPVAVPVILADPNVMLVYETDETEGDFAVSLMNQPPTGDTITVTVDPNTNGDGPSEDITLIGADPCGTITMTFTHTEATDANSIDLARDTCTDWDPANNTSCWNTPLTVRFKAIDDDIDEPPDLLESQDILVSSSYPAHPTDANFVGEAHVTVDVMDNDQGDILFSVGAFRVTSPINLKEEPMYLGIFFPNDPCYRKVTVGVTLAQPPLIDKDPCKPTEVKLLANVTGEQQGYIIGDNLPLAEVQLDPDKPDLPFEEGDDPNGLIFTADNYDEPQNITFPLKESIQKVKANRTMVLHSMYGL